MWHDIFNWLLAGIPPLVIIGWLVYWWRRAQRRREVYQTRVRYVTGLPDECRGVLMEFVRHGHKVALPPYNPFVEILTKDGVIHKHSSAGTYDAASYYFTIDLDFLAFLKAYAPKELPRALP
jgi:hypothetical protein